MKLFFKLIKNTSCCVDECPLILLLAFWKRHFFFRNWNRFHHREPAAVADGIPWPIKFVPFGWLPALSRLINRDVLMNCWEIKFQILKNEKGNYKVGKPQLFELPSGCASPLIAAQNSHGKFLNSVCHGFQRFQASREQSRHQGDKFSSRLGRKKKPHVFLPGKICIHAS